MSHAIVLRPARIGLGADATVSDALNELTPIQALIDQAKAGTIDPAQPDNAQTAVTNLTADLRDLDPTTPLASPTRDKATYILIGMALGLGLGSIALFVTESSPRKVRRAA